MRRACAPSAEPVAAARFLITTPALLATCGSFAHAEDAFGEDPALHLMEDTSSESEVEGRKDDESEDEEEARERVRFRALCPLPFAFCYADISLA